MSSIKFQMRNVEITCHVKLDNNNNNRRDEISWSPQRRGLLFNCLKGVRGIDLRMITFSKSCVQLRIQEEKVCLSVEIAGQTLQLEHKDRISTFQSWDCLKGLICSNPVSTAPDHALLYWPVFVLDVKRCRLLHAGTSCINNISAHCFSPSIVWTKVSIIGW